MGTQNFFFVSRLAECVNFLSMEKTENNNHKIECVSNLVELQWFYVSSEEMKV